MPTKICERQLSFVGYAGWRIHIWVAGHCFGARRTLPIGVPGCNRIPLKSGSIISLPQTFRDMPVLSNVVAGFWQTGLWNDLTFVLSRVGLRGLPSTSDRSTTPGC